jgi:signal transduction histidine kinase
MAGIMKAHPMNKILIGKDVSDMKDVDGKYFGRQLLETAVTKGNGRVDYNRMNPATGEVIAKSTWFVCRWRILCRPAAYTDSNRSNGSGLRLLLTSGKRL